MNFGDNFDHYDYISPFCSDKKLLKGEIISADQLAEDAGLACAVCRLVNTSSDNRLVECTECHQLYHQLCHEPKIANANDSRLVWYCASCSKKLKKTTVTPVTNVVKPNGSESKVDSKSTKEATKDKFAGLTSTSADATQLFKRVDLTKVREIEV